MKEVLASVHNINWLIQPLDTFCFCILLLNALHHYSKVNRSTIGVQQTLKPLHFLSNESEANKLKTIFAFELMLNQGHISSVWCMMLLLVRLSLALSLALALITAQWMQNFQAYTLKVFGITTAVCIVVYFSMTLALTHSLVSSMPLVAFAAPLTTQLYSESVIGAFSDSKYTVFPLFSQHHPFITIIILCVESLNLVM